MNRREFTGIFLGVMIKKIPMWLPEEAPEEDMLDIMQREMKNHNDVIRKVLKKHGDQNEKNT